VDSDFDPTSYIGGILGSPVQITSGLRSPQKNAQVGGVPNSAHLSGQAYDFVPKGMDTKTAAAKLAHSGIPFDQIEDGGDHVHISFAPANRRQVIAAKMATPDDVLDTIQGPQASPQTAATPDDVLDTIQGPKAASAAPAGAGGVSAAAKPNAVTGKPFGLGDEVMAHVPFAKDVVAGGLSLLDAAADKIQGKNGKTISQGYQDYMADLNAQQKAYEAQNPISSGIGTGLGILASGSPVKAAGQGALTLGQMIKQGAKSGATIGGLFGLGTPTENGPQTVQGRAAGGTLGAATGLGLGAALPMAAAPIAAAGRYIGGKVNSLFPSADELAYNKAKAIIDEFSGGPVTPNVTELVPGSKPTLPEATGNAGTAALYRALRDLNPNSPLVAREQANAAARNELIENTIGAHPDIEALREARDTTTDPMREAAFANATDTNVKNVRAAINRVLASPAGQRDIVASSLMRIRDKLELDYPLTERVADAVSPIKGAISAGNLSDKKLADFTEARRLLNSANRGFTSEDDLVSGLQQLAKKQKIVGPIDNALKIIKSGGMKLESDPAQLYGIRKSIGDMLSPMSQGTGSDARLASSELKEITSSLDDAIEKGAPGYKDYMSKFAEMSRPANALEFLQGLNLTDAKGNVHLQKVTNALTKLERDSNKPGIRTAKAVTDSQRQTLENIRDDLLRNQNIGLGKSLGSPTVQNAMAQKRLGLSKYIPDTLGATIGGAAGHFSGLPYGEEVGAIFGQHIGGAVRDARAARDALAASRVQSTLEDMLLNPGNYSNRPLALSSQTSPSLNQLLSGNRAQLGQAALNRLIVAHYANPNRR
jgi:hypothetical protein